MKILLIGKSLDWLEEISLGLHAKLEDQDHPLETIIVQTIREYGIASEQRDFNPDAVLVGSWMLGRDGKKISTEEVIHNLKNDLGYNRPIIACSRNFLQNIVLMGRGGATHRIDRAQHSYDPSVVITAEFIVDETVQILYEQIAVEPGPQLDH